MRKYMKSFTAVALSLVMLTSCGKTYDIPELKEPIASKDPYAIVSRGDVGEVELAVGVVVPKPYCHFWKNMVAIDEILVEVGQHVKAGDVLATADTEVARETSNQIQKEINLLQNIKRKNDEKYKVQKKACELTIKGAEKLGDKQAIANAKQSLKEIEETEKYDNALHRIRMAAKSRELADIGEVMRDGNLVAEHDGYVTYVKDVAVNNTVTKEDNVVIVSDYNDTYIQLTEPQKTGVRDYENVFVYENGVRCDLKEIPYSENELMVANSKQADINKRYVYADGRKLPEIGKQILVVQKRKSAENVIAIDKDYIYEDEQGSFVYVKNGNSSEKRYVKFGVKDENTYEVVSGLQEGEKIFAKSTVVMPENYTEEKVVSKDVVEKVSIDTVLVDDKKMEVKKFYGQGIVEKIVSDGYKTSKGELICQIATNEGAAVLNDLRTQINAMKDAHKEQCDQMDAEIKKLKDQLQHVGTVQEDVSFETQNDMKTGLMIQMGSSLEEDTEDASEQEEEEPLTEESFPPEDEREDETGEEDTEDGMDFPAEEGINPKEEKAETTPSMPEEPQQNPYADEILKCQIEIMQIEKEMAIIQYNFDLSNMEDNYQKQTRFNDGSGVKKYYADEECVVRKTYCSKGDEVGYGTRLFAIGVDGTPKMLIKSKVNLPLNQKVEIMVDGEMKYTGKIISNNGLASQYITTRNDQVYITTNDKEAANSFYMSADDKGLYADPVQKTASCISANMENVLVVPARAVYTAKRQGSEEYNYVWKQIDGEWNKQVIVAYQAAAGEDGYYIVVSGLKENDVVAVCD